MATFGEVLAHEVKFRQARPMPFQPASPIEVTATFPTRSAFETPVKKTALFWGSFMEVIGKAQSRWPGASISIRTIDTTPAWLKELRENAKLAESMFETVTEGQES